MTAAASDIHIDVGVREAVRGAAGLLGTAGMPAGHARTSAEAIVLADVWGRGSHGLLRLPYYLDRLVAGGYNPAAALAEVADTGPLVSYDGQAGLGHWQVRAAAEVAAERAGRHGVGVVAVGNSGHCGALGVYTLTAVDAGLVALVFSNGPAVMPPWGGDAPVLSTSPLAAGIPTRPEPCIVDLATSAVARGKIAERAGRGEALDAGWAFDAAGAPTIDANAALSGMLAPLGGAKGYALAFLVEALTGGLVGPALAPDVRDMYRADQVAEPQRIAHLVVTLDPRRLDIAGPGDGARLDALAEAVHRAGGRLPGQAKPRLDRLSPEATVRIPAALDGRLRAWAGEHRGAWPG